MLSSSFKTIYDKKAKSPILSISNDECIVTERDANASFNFLRICNANAELHFYNTDFIQRETQITVDMSTKLKDKNCDGMILINGKTAGEHIVLTELKSGYTAGTLGGAFMQLIHSLFKYHRLMSICEGYDLNNATIDFVLACNAPEQEDLAASALNIADSQMLNSQNNGKMFAADLLPALEASKARDIVFKLEDLHEIGTYPMSQYLLKKPIHLYLVTSTQAASNTADITFHY